MPERFVGNHNAIHGSFNQNHSHYHSFVFDHFEHVPKAEYQKIKEDAERWRRLPDGARMALLHWEPPDPLQIIMF